MTCRAIPVIAFPWVQCMFIFIIIIYLLVILRAGLINQHGPYTNTRSSHTRTTERNQIMVPTISSCCIIKTLRNEYNGKTSNHSRTEKEAIRNV